jgi:hypothetical protein
MRSFNRDAKAISLGIEKVTEEINFWESKIKSQKSVRNKSVRKRLERLREAQGHLINSPKESASLIDQIRDIQNA